MRATLESKPDGKWLLYTSSTGGFSNWDTSNCSSSGYGGGDSLSLSLSLSLSGSSNVVSLLHRLKAPVPSELAIFKQHNYRQ